MRWIGSLALAACSGETERPPAILEVERATIDFGQVPVDRVHTRTLKIRNAGPASLVVDAVRAQGGPFSAVPSKLTIGGRGEAELRVRFEPEDPGRYEGRLAFDSNDVGGSTVTVSLVGTAFCMGLGCTPPDAGTIDTGAGADGGAGEDASLDASLVDTGEPDAGTPDAGDPDAGTLGLSAYYRFEETTGALIDDSDFGNHGVPATAGLGRGVTGRVGNAVLFEGTVGQFVVQADPSLDVTSAVTIELFVDTAATGNNMSILSRGLNVSGDGWFVSSQCNNIHVDFSRTGAVGTANATTICDSLPTNDWLHVAVVNDDVFLTIYLDGNVAAQAMGGFMGPIAAPLYIGRKEPGVEPFAGRLDELRIFTVARTQDEVCGSAGGSMLAGSCLVP